MVSENYPLDANAQIFFHALLTGMHLEVTAGAFSKYITCMDPDRPKRAFVG